MTMTDEIVALAADAAPAQQAAADLAAFDAAVIRGMNSTVVRALRALRPEHGAPQGQPGGPALPDSPAWRAWLSAAAAVAAIGDRGAAADGLDCGLAARFVVCAAATALGHDCAAAVATGTRAAGLVESALAGSSLDGSHGWSLQTVSAVIGAGLAAGMMLRLPDARLRAALGICATQAAGLHAATGTDAGPLQAGKAACNAVEAAQLARLGFTSSSDPLAGRRGLLALFSP